MSDPVTHLPGASSAWPAGRPAGISPIQHPAWEEARNAILDLAAEGPVTAVIVGEPGTGKTWLLRELASSLGDHGFPTMLLMQGDLPMSLSSGAALLVDEASLMSAEARARMSAQQHGVVVLAGVAWSEDAVDPAAPRPVIIPLRLLRPHEIADFAAEWLQRSGLSDSTIGVGMRSRLTSMSGGRVSTLVKLLGEAATAWQTAPILAGGLPLPGASPETLPETPHDDDAEPPSAPPLVRVRSQRRSVYRPVLALSAIAATIALGWALRPMPPRAIAEAPPAAPVLLPPVRQAEVPHPAPIIVADAVPPASPAPAPPLVAASTPSQAGIAAAPLVPPPAPELDASYAPLDSTPPAPSATGAAAPLPPVLKPSAPEVIASLEVPASTGTPFPPKPSPAYGAGGPGLVLLAQRGDTLESLYGSVYRDRNAPPFAAVLAANPRPFRPGAIVIFPEPEGGWQRVQR